MLKPSSLIAKRDACAVRTHLTQLQTWPADTAQGLLAENR